MKTASIALMTTLLCSYCLAGEGSGANLNGCWIFKGVEEQDYVECPEVIGFYPGGSYKIFNDCHNPDPRQPIIEEGNWRIDESKGAVISLRDRNFMSSSRFMNTDEDLELTIVSHSSDMLLLENDGTVERYGSWHMPVKYCD